MPRLLPVDRWLVSVTLAIKVALFFIGIAAVLGFTRVALNDPLDTLEIWNRWDAPHYLDLAVFGYRAVDPGNLVGPPGYQQVYPGDLYLYIVFFPLYPWLVTPFVWLTGQPVVGALLVTTVISLFVAPLMYRVVCREEDAGTGLRAAWLLLVFPTAFVLHIGYTEALFLALVLGAFLAARSERWWLAGALGALAALTRVNGALLIPALAAEAATQWFSRPPAERRLRADWLAIGVVGLGTLGYLALNLAVYGDPFQFLAVQEDHWFKHLEWPWEGIDGVIGWIRGDDLGDALLYGWAELIAITIGMAATVHAAFRFRPSWFTWMVTNWLLFVSTSFVLSVPRYTLTLFPLFVSMGLLTRRREALVGVSAVSIVGFVYFAGRFATGNWAF
jgi:4-amino-4-deoxy-L-arabinose transferase-like glycosyltransferase